MRMVMAGLLIAASAVPAAAQFPPTKLQNVKVLPADIPIAALIDTMKGFTRALGVRCTYCHVGREDQSLDQYDFASDEKPAKQKARVMLRMVNAINTDHLSTLPTRRDPPIVVSCTTCHHGIAQPRTIQQVLLMAYAAGGIDSTIGQYRALRARYYGSAAYDFGEVPLSDVAMSIAAQGKIKDALRLHLLNTELLPNSSFAFRQLGFSYLKNGDTASAVTAWQHRLDIDPENPEARQLLSQIRKP